VKTVFRRFAEWASDVVASPWAFLAALAFVIVWAVSGPFIGLSEQWHFLVNGASSVVTFLLRSPGTVSSAVGASTGL